VNESEKISRKKQSYPVSRSFIKYLKSYGREITLPVYYDTLRHFSGSVPLYDKDGKDTFWETVFYQPAVMDEINHGLKRIYSLLKASGHSHAEEHLQIERIDYCVFGNSKPFRIKIVNSYNEVYDYFYIKVADASRIWGLELEHLLSPYWINFLVDKNTLVEEHISGIPGDMFIQQYLENPAFNPKRIAKEFVKFNERCYIRLLGDMRSYNFVFDITQDFDDVQFRIRAIDFDQQSYEGRRTVYLPQFFKENRSFVELVTRYFNREVIMQYQMEERSLVIRRVKAQRHRLKDLKDAILTDELSTPEKIKQLREELSEFHKNDKFLRCETMGQVVEAHMHALILADMKEP
jgi:hypothetical protein